MWELCDAGLQGDTPWSSVAAARVGKVCSAGTDPWGEGTANLYKNKEGCFADGGR